MRKRRLQQQQESPLKQEGAEPVSTPHAGGRQEQTERGAPPEQATSAGLQEREQPIPAAELGVAASAVAPPQPAATPAASLATARERAGHVCATPATQSPAGRGASASGNKRKRPVVGVLS